MRKGFVMKRQIHCHAIRQIIPYLALSLLWMLLCIGQAWSEDRLPALASPLTNSIPLELESGKSLILNSPKQIRRTSVADPRFADALVLSPTQIYLVGKQVGETSLTLWDQNDQVLVAYVLRVVPGVTWLKEQIYTLLKEKDIEVTATQDYIALSGTVTSTTNMTHALALAEAFAPKKVLNLLQVGGNHQVMLEVRIAEMNRSLARRLGINFNIISGNDFGVTNLGGLTGSTFGDGILNTTIGQAVNAIFRIQSGSITWTAFIDVLKSQGIIKILAEPNLVTLSGQEATFLAGGEVPILVAQALGANSIEFKQFGVGITFKPTVLNPDKISMRVTPEFSEIDLNRPTGVLGVPGFLTRRVSTVVELADGQSFAIGGLIKSTVVENLNKYPFLGDIPILGALFRSSDFAKNESELIIIVTPRLVKPINQAKQSLPTDGFVEPDDFTFYILGELEQRPYDLHSVPGESTARPLPEQLMFDGKLGHVQPRKEAS